MACPIPQGGHNNSVHVTNRSMRPTGMLATQIHQQQQAQLATAWSNEAFHYQKFNINCSCSNEWNSFAFCGPAVTTVCHQFILRDNISSLNTCRKKT